MIAVSSGLKVLVASKPIDFRKSMDGLAALVKRTKINLGGRQREFIATSRMPRLA
jgi:hypothetical protein